MSGKQPRNEFVSQAMLTLTILPLLLAPTFILSSLLTRSQGDINYIYNITIQSITNYYK